MNQMTVAEVTEFLKRQKKTTTFTFNMVNPDNFMMVIELKNNSDAYEFIEKNTESTFELVGANELI